jgi:glycosyltransferase involved in cell wall biosynthesis
VSLSGNGSRLRVLVGVQDAGFNGIETYAEQVAAVGATAGHDITLLVTSPEVASTVARRLDASIRIDHLGLEAPSRAAALAGRLWDGVAMRRLDQSVRRWVASNKQRYDVAHLNRSVLARAIRPTADRVVVGAWFYPHAPATRVIETWRHNRGPLLRRMVLAGKSVSYYRGDAAGFSAADCIATPTTMLTDQLRSQGLPAEWCPPPVQVAAAVRSATSRDGKIRLVSISGDLTHPRKNLRATLDAAAQLARSGRSVVVEMIGRNSDMLRRYAAELPKGVEVIFTGPLERTVVHQHVRAADALVLPSLYEEWGYVAVEALLLGVPVVTYPVYPFSSMLSDGLGVVAGDMTPVALAEAIERVVSEPRIDDLATAAAARYGAEAIGQRLSTLWSPMRSRA